MGAIRPAAAPKARDYLLAETFPELCAILVGFDIGLGGGILDEFQNWMAARHPDHPEHSFSFLAVYEALPDRLPVARPPNLNQSDSDLAIAKLFELLAVFLAR